MEILKHFTLIFLDSFTKEKLVFKIREGEHYTLHFGTQSKILDIHCKNERSGDYKTILRVRHFTCFRFLIRANYLLKDRFIDYWLRETINLGKLKKHNCLLQPIPPPNEVGKELIWRQKGGKKMKLNNTIPPDISNKLLIKPCELLYHPENSFLVYLNKSGKFRFTGIILRQDQNNQRKSFYFLSKKRHNEFNKEIMIHFYNILKNLEFENKQDILAAMRKRLF